MNAPTEPGYYWAKFRGSSEFEPIHFNPEDQEDQYPIDRIASDNLYELTDIIKWGPKIELPSEAWCQNPQQPMEVL